MAQTNVIVSYAPERRRASAGIDRGGTAGDRRWSAALVGVLMAGGTLFALGHFAADDGSTEDGSAPPQWDIAALKIEPAETLPLTARMGLPHQTDAERAVEPKPLPYLALVRSAAPQAKPAVAATPVVAVAPQLVPQSQPRASEFAAIPRVADAPPTQPEPQPQPESGSSQLAVDLVAQPTLPPSPGLRRDLEGFLKEQGHELIATEPSTTLAQAAPLVIDETAAPAIAPPRPANALAETMAAATSPASATTQSDLSSEGVAASDPVVGKLSAQRPKSTLAHASSSMAFATRSKASPVETSASSADPLYLQSYPLAVVNGEALGAVTLRDAAAGEPSVHLGALVGLLRLRMPEALFARLSGSSAANRFVSLDTLRAAGITVQFDARANRLVIDAR